MAPVSSGVGQSFWRFFTGVCTSYGLLADPFDIETRDAPHPSRTGENVGDVVRGASFPLTIACKIPAEC